MDEKQLDTGVARGRVGRLRIRKDEPECERFAGRADDVVEVSFSLASGLGAAPSGSARGVHAMRRGGREF